MTDPIPANVRNLVEANFRSISEIEALLLLVRFPQPWHLHDVARRLVVSEDHAAALLDAAVRARLVRRRHTTYTFGPRSEDDRKTLEELDHLYDTYRFRVMSIVLALPDETGRTIAIEIREQRSHPDD